MSVLFRKYSVPVNRPGESVWQFLLSPIFPPPDSTFSPVFIMPTGAPGSSGSQELGDTWLVLLARSLFGRVRKPSPRAHSFHPGCERACFPGFSRRDGCKRWSLKEFLLMGDTILCTYAFQIASPAYIEGYMGEVGAAVGQVGSLEVKRQVWCSGRGCLAPSSSKHMCLGWIIRGHRERPEAGLMVLGVCF